MSVINQFIHTSTIATVTADVGVATGVGHNVNIIGGTNISTSAAGSTLTINAGPFWTEVTAASLSIVANNAYMMNRGTLITATLPVLAAKGTMIKFTGMGAGGYKIAQNNGQIIYFGTLATTPGIGGSMSSTFDRDSIELVCVVENTDFNVLSSIGNFLVV